jgi:hypothetical protein
VLWPGVPLAEDWLPMTGAEITAELTGHALDYGDAVQTFEAGGRTVYTTTSDSVGGWRVEGDRYCSVWPPSDRWACYGMEAAPGKVRFLGTGGDVTEGRLVK